MANVEFSNYSPPQVSGLTPKSLRITLCFDGTMNNKNNTDQRRLESDVYKGNKEDASYENDYSNVARLWDISKAARIYVEGVGTEDNKSDSLIGGGTGSFSRGIRAKIRKGCQAVTDYVKSQMGSDEILDQLIIDVFGFSRGAATARNFTYEISKAAYKARPNVDEGMITHYTDSDGKVVKEENLPEGGLLGYFFQDAKIQFRNWANIKVGMLGIYDTVSSYSGESLIINFSNDVRELSLNNLAKAQHIVHFTAENEFRKNFALTRVNRGIEKSFPGVHCDVGGAYENGPELVTIERSYLSRKSLEPIRDRLLAEGWYEGDNDLKIIKKGLGSYYNLVGEKTFVHKEYSYVLLHFMEKYCENYQVQIKPNEVTRKYSIESFSELKAFKEKVEDYALNKQRNSPMTYSENMSADDRSLLWSLRKKFLHRSAKATFGMGPANSSWTRSYY